MKALATFLKVIAATCIVAVLFAMIYGIVYFTNGFTTDFKSFYLKYEDNIVKNDGKLSLNENIANTFYVYYMFDKTSSNNDYSVELIKTGNFEFKVDGKPMNWNGELDISSFYELDKKEKSFDLTVDFDIEKCLQKVFDGKKVEIDKTEFEQKMSIAKDKKRTMHTFRFAVTDFYSELLNVNSYINNNASQTAYVAETTAFLDFDIIQLTFNKNGEMTVIPVAMAPIDIVGNVNSPDIPNNNWWEKILQYIMLVLGIILIVLLVIVCWPIISLLIKAVCAIIALPFKAIGSLFKRGKKDKQTVNVVVSSAPTSGKTKKRKVSQNEIELAKKRFNKKE